MIMILTITKQNYEHADYKCVNQINQIHTDGSEIKALALMQYFVALALLSMAFILADVSVTK